jgi:transposase-like protein
VSEFESDWYDETSAFQRSWSRFRALWFGTVKCPECRGKWPGTEEILASDNSTVTYVCPHCQHEFVIKKSYSLGAIP